jgi:hypothetical protein
MRIRVLGTTAGLLLAASLAFGQTSAKKKSMPPMSMAPPAEMSQLAWLSGNWTCTGKSFASPMMGPEHPTEATVSAAPDLGGRWLVSHYREKKSAQNTMPVLGDEYWTYDASGKKWDRIAIDNMGGWSRGSASAWQNGAITWMSDGMMMNEEFHERATFTKKSDREVFYKGDIQGKDGKWAPAWETTCKK